MFYASMLPERDSFVGIYLLIEYLTCKYLLRHRSSKRKSNFLYLSAAFSRY